MNAAGPKQQRGVALITVLLVMVIAIAAVTHSILRNRIALSRTGMLLANTQLAEFVGGAEAWARVALERDWEADKEAGKRGEDPPADHAGEPWAQKALEFNPDNGKIRIQIKDLHSCFNVNNLTAGGSGRQGGQGRQGGEQNEIFERLVRNVSGKPELANAILDWLDADDTPKAPGTEDDGYLGLDVAHRTPDTQITDVSELAAVQGMEAEDWQKLRPFLCALPETDTKINVNFAPVELIEAVQPEANSEEIVRQRESEMVFSDYAQLASYGVTGGSGLVFESSYFLARIAVQLGDGGDYRQYWETTLKVDQGKGSAEVLHRQRRSFSTGHMQELLQDSSESADDKSRKTK
ncbi:MULTISPECIES: type II secretion system minor pseudopilin GspK [unclassified Microbulbifer]|uniref:type II secretion system minor pseudopilin GspK n=1 Tax=unclassified Microbulbifer TaxID=2619833 RepID=UPI0027E4F74F|nr:MULTISPECIES: type II secretion system minor pseudopilin GspK [unclassified Microbulbifer]